MKYFKKLVIVGLIFVVAFGFNFTLGAQKAKAIIGIEDTVHPWIIEIQNTIKQFIKDLPVDLNTAARFIVKLAVDRLRENIMRWAQGGFRDDNQPFAITQWSDFFKQAVNLGSAKFIQEFNLTPLCAPIKVSLSTALGLDIPRTSVPTYNQYAACSLEAVVDNVEEFYKNPSISVYGWDTWTALRQPNNNFMGSYLMAAVRKAEAEEEEKTAAQAQAQANQGYKSDAICSQTDQEACAKNCTKYPPTLNGAPNAIFIACMKSCEKSSAGICINETVKNVGTTISAEVNKAVGSDMDWLINTKELDQLVQVLFSALTNKIINGVGSIFTPSANNSSSVNKDSLTSSNPSSAFKELNESLTPQKEHELNSGVLSSTTGIVKGMNRSTITCDKSTAQYLDAIAKGYAEIVDQQSQALYVGNQAVDLKPDYEVLDPLFAPSKTYGYSWDVVPWQKYPTKCTDLLKGAGESFNSTCADINSGLPPVSRNKNCECMFSPDGLTCPPSPYPPLAKNFVLDNSSIIEQKQDFYNSCKGQYIDVTNKCSECLNRAEEQCDGKDSATNRTDCINSICNNYGNISGVVDGQDFYKKCSIEAQKANCYSCLKNYFMPDTYCNQVGDYMARAVIKYPGTFRHVEVSGIGCDWCEKDKVGWTGRKEKTCADADAATSTSKTQVSLICRILPDYKYLGKSLCATFCPITSNFTDQQLYDINDNKPSDADCGYKQISTGGEPGIWLVANGLLASRGKCCKSFNTTSKEYSQCIGADEITSCTYGKPVDQEPWCYCNNDGYRPIAYARTGAPQTSGSVGGDCANAGFSTNGAELYVYSNNKPDGDTLYIANGAGCSEADERVNNTDVDDNMIPDGTPTDATAPSGVVWSAEAISKEDWTLTNIGAGNYNAGVYHNNNTDTKSAIHVCAKCDPGDSDYPYYGTNIDQCNNKI